MQDLEKNGGEKYYIHHANAEQRKYSDDERNSWLRNTASQGSSS
jgi:hypothetical protein